MRTDFYVIYVIEASSVTKSMQEFLRANLDSVEINVSSRTEVLQSYTSLRSDHYAMSSSAQISIFNEEVDLLFLLAFPYMRHYQAAKNGRITL